LDDHVRLKHRIEYAGFRAGMAGGRLLGERKGARVGAAAAAFGYTLGIKRTVVESNIRLAFPDKSEAWVREIAAESYRHLGREILMMLQLSWMSRDEVMARTRIGNEGPPAAEYATGSGVVVVTGHLGNWEVGAAAIAVRGYRLAAVAKRASNPLFYNRIMAARARMGVEIIDFANATRPGLRALRDGKVLALAADQHAGRSGIWVPFFGRPASTFRGPALMALRTGAPLYLAITVKQPDGVYEVRLDPIDTTPTGDMEADVVRVTTEYSRQLEAAVRRTPGQYLWHHRRWREPPADIVMHPGHGAEQAAGEGVAEEL
jgi:Kdo2-lipid IVA lauroyltransferase/acyltransferase